MDSDNRSQGNSDSLPFTSFPHSLTQPTALPTRSLSTTPRAIKHKSDNGTDIIYLGSGPIHNGSSRLNLNPALLLNPKGYAGPSQSQSPVPTAPHNGINRSFNGSSNSPEVQFQFSNPQDSFTANGHPVQSNGYTTPNSNNFNNMIDRMNNVEQRTFAPQLKRRKLESEDSMSSVGSFGGGGSGDIGHYVNEKRREATNQQLPTRRVEAVDLTDGGGSFAICMALVDSRTNT